MVVYCSPAKRTYLQKQAAVPVCAFMISIMIISLVDWSLVSNCVAPPCGYLGRPGSDRTGLSLGITPDEDPEYFLLHRRANKSCCTDALCKCVAVWYPWLRTLCKCVAVWYPWMRTIVFGYVIRTAFFAFPLGKRVDGFALDVNVASYSANSFDIYIYMLYTPN